MEGSYERGKVPISWDVGAPAEWSASTEWELWSLKGEWSNWPEKAEERPAQTVGVPPCTAQSDTCLPVRAGAGCGTSGSGGQTQGERWGWLCRDGLKGWKGTPTTRGTRGSSLDPPQRQVPLQGPRKGKGRAALRASFPAHTVSDFRTLLCKLWGQHKPLQAQRDPRAGANHRPCHCGT